MGFSIPGNIKQVYLPFVLDPKAKSKISQAVFDSVACRELLPQFFSFRNNKKTGGGFGLLNVCPNTYKEFILDDLSYKLGYSPNSSGKIQKESSIIFDNIFNALPAIQIREFLPDTRLEQAMNLFTMAFDKAKVNFDNLKGDGFMDKIKNAAKKLNIAAKAAMDYIVGDTDDNSSAMKSMKEFYDESKLRGDTNLYLASGITDYSVLSFPYMMYYRLQSCVTTNIYELPCKVSNDGLYQSDGSKGWDENAVGLTSIMKKIPMVGDFISKMISSVALNNIRINFMPWWDAEKGFGTDEPEIEVKFDLFNDTIDAALINFIFVNTIVPNNRWLQYGLFQHSPSLYDIKLEGYNRLFACTGKFNVTYGGVLRNPSNNFFNKLRSHINLDTNDNDVGQKNKISTTDLLQKHLIKIPDVYHIEMKFSSVIPANFNTFIYTYSNNNNVTDFAKTNSTTFAEGMVTKIFTRFSDEMGAYVIEQVNKSIDAGK